MTITTSNQQRAASSAWRLVGLLVVTFIAYVLAAKLGLTLASLNKQVSPVWPASGVAVWFLWQFGFRLWPAVALGAFVANLMSGLPALIAIFLAIGNTLEAIVGAKLLTWAARRLPDARQQNILVPILIAALLAPLPSATIGVGALMGSALQSPSLAPTLLGTWWIGDALGILMVVPMLQAIYRSGRHHFSWQALAHWLVALAGAVVVSWVVFVTHWGAAFLFLIFPALLMATLLTGVLGSRSMAWVVSAIGIWAAYNGQGPFVVGNVNQDLLNLQIFLIAVAVISLALPTFIGDTHRRMPVAFLIAGWLFGGIIFWSFSQARLQADHAAFEKLANVAESEIKHRQANYEDALRAGASLFAASHSVERDEWAAFAGTLDIGARYPGIMGIGVVYPVQDADLPSFLLKTQADNAADFRVQAVLGYTLQAGADHYVITYIEPAATQGPTVLGRDIASESNRRMAAEAARDTGEPRMTGRITLTQEKLRRPGYLLFVPAYRHGRVPETMALRRQELIAWIYAPFITESFLRGLLGARESQLQLYLFDEDKIDQEHLLYASQATPTVLPSFESVHHLNLAGRSFTLGWRRGPEFQVSSPSSLIWAGLSFALGTVFLAGMLLSQVSFRRDAEELVIRRTSALRESENRYHSAIEVLSEGVLVIGSNGQIQDSNEAAKRILGQSPGQIYGDYAVTHVVTEIHEDGSLWKSGEFPSEICLKTGCAVKDVVMGMFRPNGELFWIMINVRPLVHVPGEKPYAVVLSFTDITERKLAQAKLQVMLDALNSSNRELQDFAFVASHDLQEPLRKIRAFSSILIRQHSASLDAQGIDYLERSANAAERMQSLVDGLLSLSRVGSRGGQFESVDLNLVLAGVVDDLESRLEQTGGIVELGHLPVIESDPIQMRQLFQNLLTNALKFCPPDRAPQVKISAESIIDENGQPAVLIRVRDNGIGFEEQYGERIFAPFQRLHSRKEYEGTGIGLAIVRRIVERHRGRIIARGSPGEGATFEIMLPLHQPLALDGVRSGIVT